MAIATNPPLAKRRANNDPPMYLPFVDKKGHPSMGLKPLMLDRWLEIDDYFETYLRRKRELLTHRHKDVFVALDATQSAQREILTLIVDHLLTHFPEHYQPLKQGIHLIDTRENFYSEVFADAPLDLAGRLVQEDLCLLMPGAELPYAEVPRTQSSGSERYILAAASVCFPLRWNLQEKMGQPVGQIHQRVPRYAEKLERPVDSVFARLRDDAPGVRFNWSIVDVPDLYLGQDKGLTTFNPTITAENAGRSLWLRVERQTLRRLPISGGILFTIRTHVYPLDQVVMQPDIATQLSHAVQTLIPQMQVYKNLLPFRQALLDYLAGVAQVS